MFNIKYSYDAYSKLDNFINSYKLSFIKLYSDTGIDDEIIIINNYIEIWNKLYSKIKWKIEEIFYSNIVLWIYLAHNKDKYIICSIDNLRIFVYYSENLKLKERYIENIEFFRR